MSANVIHPERPGCGMAYSAFAVVDTHAAMQNAALIDD